jgi:phosphatidylglycerophosphate synthase
VVRLIPHALSVARIALAYPFLLAMRGEGTGAALLAALLFSLAVTSDVLDGRAARRLGTASAKGRLLDHTADFTFVVLGLVGAAMKGALSPWLPIVVTLAFLQYVTDSWLVQPREGLRMSRLGRWNGILYFFPLAGDILARLVLPQLVPAVRLVALALVITTLLSMAERALALYRVRRTAPGSRAEETEARSRR